MDASYQVGSCGACGKLFPDIDVCRQLSAACGNGTTDLSARAFSFLYASCAYSVEEIEGVEFPSYPVFFAVGEYGDDTFRPHYHAVLFNFPGCDRGRTRAPPLYKRCCFQCDFIAGHWRNDDGEPFGKVELLPLSHALMNYIGGYVTKKMTRHDDPRLEGRHPEFARMSNRPYGIGAGALHDVADVLMRYYDVKNQLGDVPVSLGSPNLPLGRYMRGKLREMVGMPKNAPKVTLDKIAAEMRPLQLATIENAKKGGDPSLKNAVVELNKGKTASVVARHNIRKTRRPL